MAIASFRKRDQRPFVFRLVIGLLRQTLGGQGKMLCEGGRRSAPQFMVGRLSTESGKCNSFNLDGIFGNDRPISRRYTS
jgi:hypothetical protein